MQWLSVSVSVIIFLYCFNFSPSGLFFLCRYVPLSVCVCSCDSHLCASISGLLITLHLPVLSVSCQSDSSSSVVVAGYNMSAPAGSKMVLQCMSGRMVWTRDRVRDRQRVVHWDMYRDYPDYAMERVVDMFSAGEQRIYNSYNMGRVRLSPAPFKDGNFSLVIKGHTL